MIMAFSKYNPLLNTLASQDTDSGLSMPSGTTRSVYTTPGLMDDDADRLTSSMLRRSMDHLPMSSSYQSAYRSPSRTGTPKVGFTMSDIHPHRSTSPELYTRPKSSTMYQSMQNLRQTPDISGTDDILRQSMESGRLSAVAPENYFTMGLKQALNDSQTRRNVLLDKLREAQDTLRLQSSRLSKIEVEYHSSSYQVEELKSNEGKLLKQISDMEKQKQELNELRLRDLDMQVVLQDRIKELEGALQNIASDFQLLETDHARRRELVEQLSTTVELVEEENRKLHKTEQTVNTEFQCLKRDLKSLNEEKQTVQTQLESQKKEAQHWRQETERQQQLLRQSQEDTSELKIKVSSLTHKLENLESKERSLIKENDELRTKDRQLHDTLMDMKSQIAILSCDKERLYQEKSDTNKDLEKLRFQLTQLNEEINGLKQTIRDQSHTLQTKDSTVSQLMESNSQLKDELIASQKVGEKLSQELTKTKDIVNKHEDDAMVTRETLRQNNDTINNLQTQCQELRQRLTKLQSESDYLRDDFSQEKTNLQRKLDSVSVQLKDKAREVDKLTDTVNSLQQKLSSAEQSSSSRVSEYQAQVTKLQQTNQSLDTELQKREEDLELMTHRLTELQAQVNKLIIENETKSVDYENFIQLRDENQKLALNNRRLTQENSESEQMVQLLQTQRDIYARSVQEYSGKALQAEKLIEENNKLQDEINVLRDSKARVEKDLKQAKEKRSDMENELITMTSRMDTLRSEAEEYKIHKDRVEKENAALKDSIGDYHLMKSKYQQVEAELNSARAELEQVDKTVIAHLSEQNGKLNQQISEQNLEKADLSRKNNDLSNQISQLKQVQTTLERRVEDLESQLRKAKSTVDDAERKAEASVNAMKSAEEYKKTMHAELTQTEAHSNQLKKEMEQLKQQLVKSEAMEVHCKKLQEKITELSCQITETETHNQSIQSKLNKVQLELESVNIKLDEKTTSNRELSTELNIANRERQHLSKEVEKLDKRLQELRGTSDNKLQTLSDRLDKAEADRLSVQERLHDTERELSEIKSKHQRVNHDLQDKSNMVQSLTKNIDLLKAELMDSCSVQSRQEEVISTLKEETSILVDLERESKDAKRKLKELQNKNEEQKKIIAELNKVAEQKDMMEADLYEISADLLAVKSELQKAYSSMNQKELEMERLQQQLNNANIDAENRKSTATKCEEKAAELKIRLDQAEQAKQVSSATLQERIQSLEAEMHSYKTQVMKLDRQLAEANGILSSTSAQLNKSQDFTALHEESLNSMRSELDSLEAECKKLRTQNTNLIKDQNYSEAERRKAQLELKETKMDMFKLEKEKENLERSNTRLDLSLSESNRLLKSLTNEHETVRLRLVDVDRERERLRKDYKYTKEELLKETEKFASEKETLLVQNRQLQDQVTELKAKCREFEFHKRQSFIPPDGRSSPIEESADINLVKSLPLFRSFNAPRSASVEGESTVSTPTGETVNVVSPTPTFSPPPYTLAPLHSLDLSDDKGDMNCEVVSSAGDSTKPLYHSEYLHSGGAQETTDSVYQKPGMQAFDYKNSQSMEGNDLTHQPDSLLPNYEDCFDQENDVISRHTYSQLEDIIEEPTSLSSKGSGRANVFITEEISTEDSAELSSVYNAQSHELLPDLGQSPGEHEKHNDEETDDVDMADNGEKTDGDIVDPISTNTAAEVAHGDITRAEVAVATNSAILMMDCSVDTDSRDSSSEMTADKLLDAAFKDLDSSRGSLPPAASGDQTTASAQKALADGGVQEDDEILTDPEEDDIEQMRAVSSEAEPAMTREHTIKIFKQLRREQKRKQKSLPPAPKKSENIGDVMEGRNRKDSFENLTKIEVDEHSEALDVDRVKQDIISKSGRVEWRGDPREPHKRYLSSWDLTVISDTDEIDPESSSLSADKNKSLPNLSVGHGGSLDSIQSLGLIDSPLMSRHSGDSQGNATSTNTDIFSMLPTTSESGEDNSITQGETTPRSRVPVSTYSSSSSPEASRRSDSTTPTPSISSPSRIPKFEHNRRLTDADATQKETTNQSSKSSRLSGVAKKSSQGEVTKLPKLTLFKKAP